MDDVRVLLVDDEEAIREQVGAFLEARGYNVSTAADGLAALQVLVQQKADIALVDYRMPGMDGLTLSRTLRQQYPALVIIMLTAYGTVESAVEALKSGVHDYLLKPIGPAELERKIAWIAAKLRAEAELADLRELVRERYQFDNLVGATAVMRQVFAQLAAAAHNDLPVLLCGETGTGKELAARAIHVNGERHRQPLVTVDCAAMPVGLAESELFGHVKGAFTGASQGRTGRLATAAGGTLFLDELASAPEDLQLRLLRVIEDKSFMPVGSDTSRTVDVRVVAAMNAPPEEAVRTGRLRADLFYRLNVMRIDLPPLRERREDVPLLVRHFLDTLARQSGKPAARADAGLVEELMGWHWPGNVRQLRNVVEATAASGGAILTVADVPASLRPRPGVLLPPVSVAAVSAAMPGPLKRAMVQFERRHIEAALRQSGGSMRRAAELLEIDERSLRRKVARHGIDRQAFRLA